MIKRMAIAIRRHVSCDKCPAGDIEACCCFDAAAETLAAIREPTEAMVEVGSDVCSDGSIGSKEEAENIWTAMIDAALKEQSSAG